MTTQNKDYFCQCNCGWEQPAPTIALARQWTRDHLKGYRDHEVYIDRHVDHEIDDTFQSIVMANKRRKVPARS